MLQKNKKRVFIIHGYKSYPGDCWFPWLKKELQKKDIYVSVPRMPHPDKPVLEEWVSTIKKIVAIPDSLTYFIGHSLGAIAIIRYLETLPYYQKIGGVIFVAGRVIIRKSLLRHKKAGSGTSSFFKKPIHWKKLKKVSKKYVGIYSLDDPYVSTDNGRLLKKELKAKFVLEKSKGHFSRDDNVRKMSRVLNEMLFLIRK